MVVFSCKCLNVQVFGQEPQQPYDEESLETCPLGGKGSSKVIELIDPGFNFTHKCLVQRERADPWTVYICVPCHMRTHAVNVRANLLVINSELEVGEEAVLAMRSRPEYSKVFKLVLANHDAVEAGDGGGEDVVKRQSYDILQKQLGDLQNVLKSYLKAEEDVMERRIRKYEEEQRQGFERLTKHVKEEKTKLVSVLFSSSERGDFTALPEKSASTQIRPPMSHSKSVSEYSSTAPQNHGYLSRRMRDPSPDSNVFSMEELEIEEDSEEEGGGGVDIQPDSNRQHRSDPSGSPDMSRPRTTRIGIVPEETSFYEDSDPSFMSTSVPISMPQSFRGSRAKSFVEAEEEYDESAEFADIASNMQALSESVHDRDRYIFGDRPRQRVNTGDFTQVKLKWNS